MFHDMFKGVLLQINLMRQLIAALIKISPQESYAQRAPHCEC